VDEAVAYEVLALEQVHPVEEVEDAGEVVAAAVVRY
jgi:hypothetical protein